MEKRLIVFVLLLCCSSGSLARGQTPADSVLERTHMDGPAAVTGITLNDSAAQFQASLDSLARADSIYLERELHSKQLANMRHYHLTGSDKPEVLRIDGLIVPETDKIVLHFTIKSASGKLLWNERWKAEGYFDPADTLTDSIKLHRLRHVIHVCFANENFSSIDSSGLGSLFNDATPADLKPGSPEIKELEQQSSVVYNVFRSRDYFYGLIWLPSKHKFVRLWKN
jgi:hypothetical protein